MPTSKEATCPIVFLDCTVVKVHQDNRVINKPIYLALGINTEGGGGISRPNISPLISGYIPT